MADRCHWDGRAGNPRAGARECARQTLALACGPKIEPAGLDATARGKRPRSGVPGAGEVDMGGWRSHNSNVWQLAWRWLDCQRLLHASTSDGGRGLCLKRFRLNEFPVATTRSPGVMGVDWEERVDFERLRAYRLDRVRQQLEDHGLGALLLFETSNIRYATATQIGYWAFNKGERWALITRNGRPRIWDFGSAAKAHRLQLPSTSSTPRTRSAATPVSRERSAPRPDSTTGRQRRLPPFSGTRVSAVSRSGWTWPRPVCSWRLQKEGLDVTDGQQAMMMAREIKSADEITLLTQASAMVDGVYQDIFEYLKPGVRESDVVGSCPCPAVRDGLGVCRGDQLDRRRAMQSPPPCLLRPPDPARATRPTSTSSMPSTDTARATTGPS